MPKFKRNDMVVFKEIEDDHQLVNALYVSPHTLPVIKEGTVITYA